MVCSNSYELGTCQANILTPVQAILNASFVNPNVSFFSRAFSLSQAANQNNKQQNPSLSLFLSLTVFQFHTSKQKSDSLSLSIFSLSQITHHQMLHHCMLRLPKPSVRLFVDLANPPYDSSFPLIHHFPSLPVPSPLPSHSADANATSNPFISPCQAHPTATSSSPGTIAPTTPSFHNILPDNDKDNNSQFL